MTFEEFKDDLIIHVDNQASFREEKAMEYPDEFRNERSAEALRTLSKKLSQLSSVHPKLRAAWGYWWGLKGPGMLNFSDDSEPFIDTEQDILRRYGFHSPEDGDPETFLDEYISLLKKETDIKGHDS